MVDEYRRTTQYCVGTARPGRNAVAGIDHVSLTKAMDKAGMTPKQLADDLGLSLQYVCDIRNGRRKLKRRPDLVKQIAEKIDVPIHWIAAREAS